MSGGPDALAHMEVNQALCFLGIDSISRFGSSVLEFVFHAPPTDSTRPCRVDKVCCTRARTRMTE